MRRIHQFGVGERPYTVAYEPLAGKRVIARYPYQGWFGLHRGEVYVLTALRALSAASPRGRLSALPRVVTNDRCSWNQRPIKRSDVDD